MRPNQNLVQAAAAFVFFIVLPTHALADGVGPAARLSAALGGAMGDGMSDAGEIGHGSIKSTVEPRLGRSEVYRRRVALDAQLAASLKGQSAECATQGRTPTESCSTVTSTFLQAGLPTQRFEAEFPGAVPKPAR